MSTFDFIYKLSLIATLLVLIWYTVETSKIRKVNTEQKDLQLMPAMMIYIRRQSGSERPFIRNVGFGTAVAVRVLKAAFKVEGKQFEFQLHLVDGNNTLVPQEERMLGVNLIIDGNRHDNPLPNFLAYFDPANLKDVEIFKEGGVIEGKDLPKHRYIDIEFSDITGQKYTTTVSFGADGIAVAKAPKRAKHERT